MSSVLLNTMGNPGGQDPEKVMCHPEVASPVATGKEPGPEPE